ncbi:MAG: 4Fe-4S binding protein [Spirochaetes bacterium]|nr:4Fe-4S binding protein [Spirochaetota bacterium]
MDRLNPIYTERTECQDCYKCLRECTVKAIRVVDSHAEVVPELCILCGHCVSVCPVGAKKVRDDVGKVKHVLSTKRTVYVSLAPSFVSEFSETELPGLFKGLETLGFAGVSETALGAEAVSTILANDLSEAMHEGKKLYLSSACPTVVEFLKKYQPAVSTYLMELSSPLMAHAQLLKRLYGEDIGVVFIGPCIAKKRESDARPELIDAALTFREVRNWFADEGFPLEPSGPGLKSSHSFSPPFVPRNSKDGSLYPVDGGMVRTILNRKKFPEDLCTSISGIHEIPKALEKIEVSQLKAPLFVEILACTGGCVNGPGCTKKNGTLMKWNKIQQYYKQFSSREEDPSGLNLLYRWRIPPLSKGKISDREIREALSKVGKYSVEDELNCGGCGYDTCRQFAEAFVMKKAEPTMCLSYMRKLAQKKANALLKTMPTGVVVVDDGLFIVECNRNFARLLGREVEELYETKPGLEKASLKKLVPFADLFVTVLETGVDILEKDIRYREKILKGSIFTVERGRYVGGIFQDITIPFIQKDRIVEQAEKIIQKQLSTVQKIAYLLGENAAESEVMLNAIIQSFGQESR